MQTKISSEIKALLVIIGFLIVVYLGFFAFEFFKKQNEVTPTGQTGQVTNTRIEQASIIGCYVATIPSDVKSSSTAKDVYTLNVQNQIPDGDQTNSEFDVSKVSGTLSFKNFQKDSSSGTFTGIYSSKAWMVDAGGNKVAVNGSSENSYAFDIEDVLFGEYTFQSEGTTSVAQIMFKKVGTDFVRGYGEMNATGDRFDNLSEITYESSPLSLFKKTACNI